MAAASLSIKQMCIMFGVSHVAIHNWHNNKALPDVGERTPSKLRAWAKREDKTIAVDPDKVLTMKGKTILQRLANGHVTGARAAAKRATNSRTISKTRSKK